MKTELFARSVSGFLLSPRSGTLVLQLPAWPHSLPFSSSCVYPWLRPTFLGSDLLLI